MNPQQLDPSAVIVKAFDIYKRNAAVLLPLAFGLFAIQGLAIALLAGNLVGSLVAGIIAAILGYLFQGIVVEVARDVEDGVLDSTAGQLISAVVPAILPLFVVSVLAGLAIAFGVVLFIVPGLFLMTIFAVVAPVTVLERPGIIAAFSRSRQLVHGSGWQVFGLILFNLVVNQIATRLGNGMGGLGGDLVGWVIAALLAPLSALLIAVAYLRLREAHGEPPLPSGVATADGPLSRPGF